MRRRRIIITPVLIILTFTAAILTACSQQVVQDCKSVTTAYADSKANVDKDKSIVHTNGEACKSDKVSDIEIAKDSEIAKNVESIEYRYENIKCLYYDEKSFRRSVSHSADKGLVEIDIKGGITPHHLLADDLIASFFKTVSVKSPEVVIVLAPNHKNAGDYRISTCYSSWETPFGLLETEADLIKKLVSDKKAGINKDLVEEEHSISSLIPYLKYYIPDCKIVPLLLHGDYTLEDSKELGSYISGLVKDKKYLVVASVDFSHYLTGEAADKMDDITLKAIEKRDLKQICLMNNDNLDSPSSIITLLSAMNAVSVEEFTVLDHSNSDRISGTKAEETTSYFTMIFY